MGETMTIRAMSLDQLRDWHAKREGWEFKHNSWWHPTIPALFHPFPNTLDGAASAMPEGWWWGRNSFGYRARKVSVMSRREILVRDTGNEVEDRYRLAAMAREAQEKS